MSTTSITTTSRISGRGTLLARELSDWLNDMPDEATITISKDRETNHPTDPGGTWTLTATF